MFGFDMTPVNKEDLSKRLYIGWVNQAIVNHNRLVELLS